MTITIKRHCKSSRRVYRPVSKVINGKMYVSPATRENVLRIMKELEPMCLTLQRRIWHGGPTKRYYMRITSIKGRPIRIRICSISYGGQSRIEPQRVSSVLAEPGFLWETSKRAFEEAIMSHSADGIILSGVFATPQIERPYVAIRLPSNLYRKARL